MDRTAGTPTALTLRQQGGDAFHGFALAKEIQDLTRAHRLRAHSTLYRVLRRLEEQGYLRMPPL